LCHLNSIRLCPVLNAFVAWGANRGIHFFPLAFLRPRVTCFLKHMKKYALALVAITLAFTGSVQAQMGRMPGPGYNRAMAKLFGENSTFSADVEIQSGTSGQTQMTIPGKMVVDATKSRFEMKLADAKGSQMSPDTASQMKAMGMDRTITISRPDLKLVYMIYPGLTSYVASPSQDPDAAKPDSAFKVDTTELGKETVDGHPCIKNKMVVTDDQGKTTESTVWNATDMKKFPVKIVTSDRGNTATILFKNVKTSKPDAAPFDPPSDYKKYDNTQALMMEQMQKRMGGMNMPQPQGRP
jgi:hypothetical protein